jgi:DNA polymerase III delta prime subunit
MEQPLLYKYRPKNIEELNIKKELLELLNNLIEYNNLNLLFLGDSDSGKSTIIKKIIEKYYCNENIDDNILVINPLKEQGISFYRYELKTFCQSLCNIPGKKKTIILDDLDYINDQSQAVFRNCIDKYGKNINFIASCKNIQKIIDTLQSRLLIINLEMPTTLQIKNKMENIISSERLIINNDAKEFILLLANNSYKILINYLEKFKLINEEITKKKAINLCTNISYERFDKYTELCKSKKNLKDAVKKILEINYEGYSVMDILDNYFNYIKLSLLSEGDKHNIIKLLSKYISIFYTIHEDEIELIIFTKYLCEILDKS